MIEVFFIEDMQDVVLYLFKRHLYITYIIVTKNTLLLYQCMRKPIS